MTQTPVASIRECHRRPELRTDPGAPGGDLLPRRRRGIFDAAAYEAIGFQAGVRDRIALIGEQEAEHVAFLTAGIEAAGGTPVAEGIYNFGYTDLAGFLSLAATIEGVGVSAYQGAAPYLIDSDDLLTAALTIHGVEARHAAYLNLIGEVSPFPDAVNPTLTYDEVVALVTPFIVG